jgi:O-antigen/teichoic acid export membrane protein
MGLTRNILRNLFGTGLFSLLHLIIGIFLARLLTPAGLGQYSLALSFITIAATVMSLGVGSASIYAINNRKEPADRVSTNVLKLSAWMAVAMAAAVTPFLFHRGYFGELPLQAILSVCVYGISLLIFETTYPILIAFFRIREYTVVRLLPGSALLFLMVLALYTGELTLTLAFLFTAVGQWLSIAFLLWYLRDKLNRRIPLSKDQVKPLVGYGLKLNLSYVMHLLNWEIGLFLVRYLTLDFSEVGFYRIGIRFGGILLLAGYAIGPLLYSKWSSAETGERRRQAETVSRVFWLVLVVFLGLLELFAGWIIPVLYGPEYFPAVLMLRIILIGIGARFLMIPMIEVFTSGGKPLLGSLVHGVSLSLMAVLMWFLVPDRGGTGAAIAFALGNCAGLVACYALGYLRFRIELRRCFLVNWEDLVRLFGILRSLTGKPA